MDLLLIDDLNLMPIQIRSAYLVYRPECESNTIPMNAK